MKTQFREKATSLPALLVLLLVSSAIQPSRGAPLSSGSNSSEMAFKKVEVRTTFGNAREGDDGTLLVNPESIRFVAKKGGTAFSIPSDAVTDLFYSRVSGRRIKTAVFVSPLLLLSKGKKHYLTVSFNDGKGLAGAVELRLDKSNYRGVLRSVESVSNVTVEFDQEGIKDEKETVARRGGSAAPEASAPLGRTAHSIEFVSDPEGAEIEIDGVFVGTTPRIRSLNPGQYRIKISKRGYKSWERTVEIDAHDPIPVRVELEPE